MNKTLSHYVVGYLLSLALTLAAAGLVTLPNTENHTAITLGLVALALVQFAVQLICFLHVGHEKKPRYNLTVFAFALIVVCIVVGGTLWIMNNLRAEHPTPEDIIESEASTLTPHP